MLLAALLPIGAWLVHAHAMTGRFVPINSANTVNFFFGNNPYTPLYKTWWFGSHEPGEPGVPPEYTALEERIRAAPPEERERLYRDQALAHIKRAIPVCADESAHDRASLPALADKYDAVNIKLDKTGGLTEALAMGAEAERQKFTIMAGCMVATSLAMAPAVLLAQRARFVDLDGPLLLGKDRPGGLRYEGSLVYPHSAALWG